MKINIFIQARYNSSRLSGKVLKKIKDKTIIQIMYDRLSKCKNINKIIFLTSSNPEDDNVYQHCIQNNILCLRGSEKNVLERYYMACQISDSDIIVRCTGDCPLIDYRIVDNMIENFLKENIEYYTHEIDNNNVFPDGFGVEIFTKNALEDAYKNANSDFEKEHVSPFIIKNYETEKKYQTLGLNLEDIKLKYSNIDFTKLHLSVDTKEEFEFVGTIFNNFDTFDFSCEDILELLNTRNDIILQDFKNENLGAQLYLEAKKIIPGGTQLLSKRPEMFLPDQWPSYYMKANGIEITTLDGVKMKDFCYMAIGACILGYADPDVNNAVQQSVSRGNISTLNCPSEVELTKLLLELHPWADMARYTRASGEACSMAVRIGRASSGKDKIAFCGYHGWHDWYLSTNHNDDSTLDNHLIKGLSPSGVPKALKNTAFPFNYNRFEELLKITDNHDIGCIIMEPQRSEPPVDNFLQKIRNLCDEKGIVLILDEVSAAFRLNTGGLHLKLGIEPDLAVFGKSLGNGYASAAVIGRRKYMESAQGSFISSTFFTEDIGFTSAIAMIKKHKELNVGKHIEEIGTYFQTELRKIADKVDIKLSISGLPCFSAFNFEYENGNAIKTLYVQKMLERNILAKNAFYPSYSHKKEDIIFYLKNIEEVFKELKDLIDNNHTSANIESQLKGPVAHTGFQRLA